MSDTMKVVQIEKTGGPEVLQVVQRPIPQPGAKEVRIRVQAAGLNYSDIMIREGQYLSEMELPYVMGREFAGVIDAVGAEVKQFKVGDQVTGSCDSGAMAEYLCVHNSACFPYPEALGAENAVACLIQGITAVHCVEDLARVKEGESVLVHAAAGGVGTLAVQLARMHGAKVYGTASNEDKRKLVSDLGATPLDYTQPEWVDQLLEMTDGKGVDVVLESVGGAVFRQSFTRALAIFGRMIVLGMASKEMANLHNRQILSSNKTLTGYFLGTYFPDHLDRVASASMRLAGYMMEGKVKPVIGGRYPLDQARQAFDVMQDRQSMGKVVLLPGE